MGIHLHLNGKSHTVALDLLLKEFPEISDVQIFVYGPANIKPANMDPKISQYVRRNNIGLYVHGSYLCVPWRSPFLQYHTLLNIRAAHKIGAENTVAHIPFLPVDEVISGITKLAGIMKREKLHPMLTLEQSATIPHATKSYESPVKLNRLTEKIYDAKLHTHVNICIDTAHVHSSSYLIRTYAEGKKYCDSLDKRLIGMIHLNGNSTKPGLEKTSDTHEVPLSPDDLIWGGLDYAASGCRAFVDMAISLNIPMILEINPRHSHESIRAFLNKISI